MEHSKTIENLINIFKEFPGIGARSAQRFVFYLIKQPNEKIDDLIKNIQALKNNIKLCAFCGKIFEPNNLENENNSKLCEICRDPRRDKSLLCIVEKQENLDAIENTNEYKGLYFILLNEQRINLLIQYIKKHSIIKEIILAINPTTKGKIISLKLKRILKDIKNIKITELGIGVPIGGELEYADTDTLKSSLRART